MHKRSLFLLTGLLITAVLAIAWHSTEPCQEIGYLDEVVCVPTR